MIILNPHLVLPQFFKSLAANRQSLLILDYYGTLAPFSINPHEAYPYPGVFERIQLIMALPHTAVVIMSGRALESLKELLPMEPLPELWGSHGGERLPPHASQAILYPLATETQQVFSTAAELALQLAPKLYCEKKPLSVALHWRGKDPLQGEKIKEKWNELIGNYALEPLQIHSFDGGIELRPVGVNKGKAVQTLLKEFPENTAIAYLGDDVTDEEAFQMLQEKALKVLVRDEMRPTHADLYLKPPEELLEFLNCWIEALGIYARNNK